MAITVDVFTKIVDSSLKQSTDQIERKFNASGQKAADEFSKALASGIEKSPALQKQFDKVADLMGKQRIAQEQLNAAEAKGTASRAQLISLQEKLGKATRDVDREIRSTADNVVRFGQATTNTLDGINRSASGALMMLSNLSAGTRFGALTSQVATMSSAFVTAGQAVGGMSASMVAAAGVAGGAVVIGLAAATAGVVKLTSELYNLGSEFDTTFDNLQVKTGATGDVLEQLKTVVKDVAGQVPESFAAIGDITAQVTQTMELTTQQTEQLVVALGNLKHMGVDVNIHSLGMAFKALDVNQQDYLNSTEQVLNLTQSTGLSFDAITSSIEGNAGALKAFGFTFGEALTVIKQFEDVGIDPDKGLGALNKAFKALTEAGLEPTKENLQLVFDEIKGFIDSGQAQKANEELNQLFGPRGGGLSWLPLIKEGKLNLDALADAAEAPSTNIQDLADRTYDLSESFTMLKQDVQGALEPLSSELFNIVNEGLKGIGDWIEANKPEIIGFFTGLATQVVNLVQVLTGMLGTALYDIGQLLPDFLGGDKFTKAGQDLMNFSAKLDEMQGRLQAAGDKANDAARAQRELGDNTQGAADATDNLADALERAANAPAIPFTPGIILGTDPVPGAPSDPFNPGGVLGPGVKGPRRFASSSAMGGSMYGLPRGSAINYGQAGFPSWVYQVADAFGMEASTYPGHQEGKGVNQGIDWRPKGMSPFSAAGAATMQRFAQYLASTGMMEQVIYQNAMTGAKIGVADGQLVGPGTSQPQYYGRDFAGHQDHVHSRQSRPIPLPGGMMRFGPGESPLPPGTPSPIPGLQPGPVGSTFGVNEYGEPGFYRPDSDSIRNAERAADKAEERVEKANKRISDIQKDIADLEAQRTALNAEKTDKKIADLQDQLKDAISAAEDAKYDAEDAKRRLADARQGRFSPAREQSRSRGRAGGLGDVGAPLAEDMGLSEGLPGLAKFATTALANMAFAPMIGALSAVSAASPAQGGYGLLGMLGAQNLAGGGSPLGLSTPPIVPGLPPVGPATVPSIGPAPLGGGVGTGLMLPQSMHGGSGAAPGPKSFAPSAGPGGGGFAGLGGLPLQGITSAIAAGSLAIDAMAPGAGAIAGQAAQMGVQLANRTAGFVGQLAGIGVGGLLETFLPRGSTLADPNKSWLGRLAAGFAGARPALPNAAGGGEGMNPAGESARPQTPEEAQKLQAENGGGAGGPMVQVGAINNYTPDSGQTLSNQMARMTMQMHAAGGKR